MNDFYVYTHTKMNETVPFYIGKGRGNRAYSQRARSNFWKNVAKTGYTVELEFENLDESTAFQMERDMIQMWGRRDNNTGILVNLTDGGDGASGHIHSDEHKKRIGLKLKGRKISDEHRKKIGDCHRGKTMSLEARKKMSRSRLGKKHSEDHKVNIGKSLEGKSISETGRLNMSMARGSKPTNVKSPDGMIYEVCNIREFARNHNLHNSHFSNVIKGKFKSHKGWILSEN